MLRKQNNEKTYNLPYYSGLSLPQIYFIVMITAAVGVTCPNGVHQQLCWSVPKGVNKDQQRRG